MIGYPLRLSTDTAVFYNTPGLFDADVNQGIPGLSSVESVDKAKESDILQYARHGLHSYFLGPTMKNDTGACCRCNRSQLARLRHPSR